MTIIAGVDIGNNSTEVALAKVEAGGRVSFLASSLVPTTGIKGTVDNVPGVKRALEEAVARAGCRLNDISLLRLNEATPVIADVAMEAITETVITESTMIGHNPATPGGTGLGVGRTVPVDRLPSCAPGDRVVAVVPASITYDTAARLINQALDKGVEVQGAIAQRDDGVLIYNRVKKPIPVVDEVQYLERVPLSMPAAVEVAPPGGVIQTLSNPYGIATVFDLTPEETRNVVPVARALTGNRSAVVIKTPAGDVKERRIPAGRVILEGEKGRAEVDLEEGAGQIMAALDRVAPLVDASGTPGSNVGGMLEKVRQVMADLSGQSRDEVRIRDILAVDTLVPQRVVGGLAGEFSNENAVALAAMVRTSRFPMGEIARRLEAELGFRVEVGGVEAQMAILGALTTPGVDRPVAILDLGGGSTDAAFINREGKLSFVHLAGAGELVTMLIASELGLEDRHLAEEIKRHPLAKVESLFHIRMEDGTVVFYDQALDPGVFGRVVVVKERGELVPVPVGESVEKIRAVRRAAKEKVFVTNALRALSQVAPGKNIRLIDFVVLVGGSALDFEVPYLISDALAHYGVVTGRANIRGTEGPRNAVATGLVLSAVDGQAGGIRR
ncbi:diol dehydratase reactivase subunit alpha [Desulfofundulus thermosubterraneus]|uniref:Diol dehydratase reactivase alpha subunit n=1 Tax=Desulfofundulus thermosubterraneus DSM 16057 TaxID=1121432 RepID=A0A1M6DVZ5_9FIRM|nr:diol dehydratase reactivase subunit alpha [Desulfofundulus thermosubterraneus]SHI77416.1 diol dehydratase reactivase alpha subunit [Desulfofundulus thermosubterraneus DSM 16057]